MDASRPRVPLLLRELLLRITIRPPPAARRLTACMAPAYGRRPSCSTPNWSRRNPWRAKAVDRGWCAGRVLLVERALGAWRRGALLAVLAGVWQGVAGRARTRCVPTCSASLVALAGCLFVGRVAGCVGVAGTCGVMIEGGLPCHVVGGEGG
jgi:hypothetical protein